jgi:hypothetical protein
MDQGNTKISGIYFTEETSLYGRMGPSWTSATSSPRTGFLVLLESGRLAVITEQRA